MNIEDCTVIDEILQANDNSATNLISILQQIQGKYRYLSQVHNIVSKTQMRNQNEQARQVATSTSF